MKRIAIIALAALFCAALLAGCTGKDKASSETTEDLSYKYIPVDDNMGDWLP